MVQGLLHRRDDRLVVQGHGHKAPINPYVLVWDSMDEELLR